MILMKRQSLYVDTVGKGNIRAEDRKYIKYPSTLNNSRKSLIHHLLEFKLYFGYQISGRACSSRCCLP